MEAQTEHARIRRAAAERDDLLTAERLGVSSAAMARMENEGVLARVGTGIYLGADVHRHALVEAAAWTLRYPRAIVCMMSAAVYHDLTDGFSRGAWLYVPKGTTVPRSRTATVHAIQASPRLIDPAHADLNGLTTVAVHGVEVTLTDPDRTTLDLWRFTARIPREHALGALGRRVRAPDFQVASFARLARRLRVWRQIEPTLQGAML